MAKKIKTTETSVDVYDFINAFVEKAEKKEDSYRLIELMQEWSGFPPKMWGPSIIGFGTYHYKYESGHEGDMPVLAFSPRKAAFSLYVYVPGEENKKLLEKLGKFKMAKACIYFSRLSDLDVDVLRKLCRNSITYVNKKYGTSAAKPGKDKARG